MEPSDIMEGMKTKKHYQRHEDTISSMLIAPNVRMMAIAVFKQGDETFRDSNQIVALKHSIVEVWRRAKFNENDSDRVIPVMRKDRESNGWISYGKNSLTQFVVVMDGEIAEIDSAMEYGEGGAGAIVICDWDKTEDYGKLEEHYNRLETKMMVKREASPSTSPEVHPFQATVAP